MQAGGDWLYSDSQKTTRAVDSLVHVHMVCGYSLLIKYLILHRNVHNDIRKSKEL